MATSFEVDQSNIRCTPSGRDGPVVAFATLRLAAGPGAPTAGHALRPTVIGNAGGKL